MKFMNGCFDNQLPAVVFDGVKTSRMLSCQAVTIGRDVRGVVSLAWKGVRGTGGDWSVIDHAAQPLPTPPLSPPLMCPSSMLNYTVMLTTVVATTATLSSNSCNGASVFDAFYYRSTEGASGSGSEHLPTFVSLEICKGPETG